MMDGVDQILHDFEKTVAAASAEAISRLRAISARQPAAALPAETMRTPPTDLISAAQAGKLARRSKQTIARWCAAHPWEAPGGFAIFIRGRWHVSKAAFAEFLSRSPGT
jgi:hypothetical protein